MFGTSLVTGSLQGLLAAMSKSGTVKEMPNV